MYNSPSSTMYMLDILAPLLELYFYLDKNELLILQYLFLLVKFVLKANSCEVIIRIRLLLVGHKTRICRICA